MKSSKAQKEWKRKNYLENAQYYIERDRIRRNGFKAIIREAKNRPCNKCGGKFHFSAMDFHHLGNKSFEVSDLPNISSEKRLLEEISKCEVICSNCHRELTWKEHNDDAIEK